MTLKINDARTVVPLPAAGSRSAGLDQATLSPGGQSSQSRPAASVDLSVAAQTATQTSAAGLTSEVLDMDLVQEIRERIATGAFEIDYQQIAGNLLRDAVAAIQANKTRQ